LYTSQISARLLWYCQDNRALGFTINIFGLSFPPIFKVFTSMPSKNLSEKSCAWLSSITKNPPQGLSKSWETTVNPKGLYHFFNFLKHYVYLLYIFWWYFWCFPEVTCDNHDLFSKYQTIIFSIPSSNCKEGS
jgi:hypothetical protein